jgi:CHAT domain-containing protein
MESELIVQRRQEMRNRDLFKIGELQKQVQEEKESARVAADEVATLSPAVSVLFAGTDARASRYASELRPGTVLCDYLLTQHSVLLFLLSKDAKGPSIRTYEVPVPRDRVEDMLQRIKAQRGEQVAALRELFDQFIKPVQSSLQERMIIIPPPEMEGIPFHAFLAGKDRTLLDIVDVSYLPHISFLPQITVPRKFLSTVLAFGFSTRNPWPLEYELHDVRSFYKEATTFSGQAATEQQLFGAIGDLLQCSFDFHTDVQVPSRSSFAVSSGSITAAGAEIPVERLTMLYPFSVVYLCDQQFGTTGLTSWHAAILMMNGTSTVIANLFPSEQKTNKVFSEKFYSTISNGGSSNDAYRAAVLTLKGTTNAAVPSSWGMFFKFGR